MWLDWPSARVRRPVAPWCHCSLPRDRAAEFFGFWGVFGKLAAIVGPLAMGVLADVWGLRESILVTLVFFLAGLAVLRTVRIPSRAA